MDRAIRIFHLNHSVYNSVSEHQESAKSAKYYTEREKKQKHLKLSLRKKWNYESQN